MDSIRVHSPGWSSWRHSEILHPTVQNVILVSKSEVTSWRNGFNCSHQLLGRKVVVVVTMGGGGGIEWGEVPSKSVRENFSVIQLL